MDARVGEPQGGDTVVADRRFERAPYVEDRAPDEAFDVEPTPPHVTRQPIGHVRRHRRHQAPRFPGERRRVEEYRIGKLKSTGFHRCTRSSR